MNTPLEFYKKLLAYDDELDLDKPSPLTHKGVIHLMTEYSNQLHKLSVGGPASDVAEGAAVGQRSVGTNAEGEYCINVHNLSIREFGKCLKCGSTTRRKAPSGGHL